MSVKLFYLTDYHQLNVESNKNRCLLCMQISYSSKFHSIVYNKCMPMDKTRIFGLIMSLILLELIINICILKFSIECVLLSLIVGVSVIIDLIRCFS